MKIFLKEIKLKNDNYEEFSALFNVKNNLKVRAFSTKKKSTRYNKKNVMNIFK